MRAGLILTAHVLKLECIGDDRHMLFKRIGLSSHRQPWVAQVLGPDPVYEFTRVFLRGKKDYAEANSVGSRGVFLYFFLDKEGIYEVNEQLTWNRGRRYFAELTREKGFVEIADAGIVFDRFHAPHLPGSFWEP